MSKASDIEQDPRLAFTMLNGQENRHPIPIFPIGKLDLWDISRQGSTIGKANISWIKCDNNQRGLLMYSHTASKDSPKFGEHMFQLSTSTELIRLFLPFQEQDKSPHVIPTIDRMVIDKAERTLPPGIGMLLYYKLPTFFQKLADKYGPFTHVLTYGQGWNGNELTEDKWRSKFMPFVEEFGYEPILDIPTFKKKYE